MTPLDTPEPESGTEEVQQLTPRQIRTMESWVKRGIMTKVEFDRITGRDQKQAAVAQKGKAGRPVSPLTLADVEAALEMLQNPEATRRQWVITVGPLLYDWAENWKTRTSIEKYGKNRVDKLRREGDGSAPPTEAAPTRRRGRPRNATLSPEQLQVRRDSAAKARAARKRNAAARREAAEREPAAVG